MLLSQKSCWWKQPVFPHHLSRLASNKSRARPATSSRLFGTWPKIYPRRVRVITCDVTGTLVSFRGTLEEHYLGSAEKYGVDLPTDVPIAQAFRQAYEEVSDRYPCFGGKVLPAKEWWRKCVGRSFELCGAEMSPQQSDQVFQRIYSTFGSQQAYEKFIDAAPFLNWAKRRKIVCGILSNADERYGDSILPMLGLTHDDLQFQCYSKDVGAEKPDSRIYRKAMESAKPFLDTENDPLEPSHVLHIGNSYDKDFVGARRMGMHAVLLERYDDPELASEWKRRGAMVFEDLTDVIEFLGRSHCHLG